MLPLLLAACLACPVPAVDASTADQTATATPSGSDETEKPDPAKIRAALQQLADGMRASDPGERVAAVRTAAGSPSEEMAAAIARHLGDAEQDVRSAVLEALRYFEHDQALEELHRIHRRRAKELARQELLPALYRAIGEHESPSSLALLGRDLFKLPDRETVQARVFALGRIRDKRSVELLIDSIRKNSTKRVAPQRANLRLALLVLTGVDRGTSLESWTEWWKSAEADFEIPVERPPLPRAEFRAWVRYWGFDESYERTRRREDRGRR